MAKKKAARRAKAKPAGANPFALRSGDDRGAAKRYQLIREGVICDTETLGQQNPQGMSPAELVLHAPGGFIPLWEKDTTLWWRFRNRSFDQFTDPEAAKAAIRTLLAEALLAWGDAAPVKFFERDDVWDFEIVMRKADECNIQGCVLASAFFPDSGRHELTLYPKMFTQDRQEIIETLLHELGHVFGLRHFFAQVSETAFPSEIFGTHNRFTIMNYGPDSRLTETDKSDLESLYLAAWSGVLTHINGTPIRFVRPFHASGTPVEDVIAATPPPRVIQPRTGAANYYSGSLRLSDGALTLQSPLERSQVALRR